MRGGTPATPELFNGVVLNLAQVHVGAIPPLPPSASMACSGRALLLHLYLYALPILRDIFSGTAFIHHPDRTKLLRKTQCCYSISPQVNFVQYFHIWYEFLSKSTVFYLYSCHEEK
jgi:hypothetical protein